MKNLPDFQLEQLALGELPAAEREKFDSDLTRQRLAGLAASDREILAAHPPADMARRIREKAALRGLDAGPLELAAGPARAGGSAGLRLERRRRFAVRIAGFGILPLAAAAALAISFVMPAARVSRDPAGQASEETRIKGLQPRLLMYRKAAGGSQSLAANARVRPRDLIQLAYVAAGRPYGAILSVDGRGSVSQHFPERGSAAAGLDSSGEVLLPFAYELDDAPRFEAFFLVTADRPFGLDALKAAAREAGARLAADRGRGANLPEARLELAAGLEQTSFTLIKE